MTTGAGDPMARKPPDAPVPQHYEIRLRGHLGELMRHGFPDLEVHLCGDDTLLSGALVDQSALHGVLAQLESLGLELLEVRRLPT